MHRYRGSRRSSKRTRYWYSRYFSSGFWGRASLRVRTHMTLNSSPPYTPYFLIPTVLVFRHFFHPCLTHLPFST
ncbi:hypothetical protein BDZ94DRAFT_735443 [Collybia nuda]|uniref:Uncharacterized protein n=1 Tax=Collybia nuda TaxID=64659 RepID=A0A9P5Y6Z6_9AGAR|nr:hypothetical protein BDZ94DRAFT_735443 [Collybia nuda]